MRALAALVLALSASHAFADIVFVSDNIEGLGNVTIRLGADERGEISFSAPNVSLNLGEQTTTEIRYHAEDINSKIGAGRIVYLSGAEASRRAGEGLTPVEALLSRMYIVAVSIQNHTSLELAIAPSADGAEEGSHNVLSYDFTASSLPAPTEQEEPASVSQPRPPLPGVTAVGDEDADDIATLPVSLE